MSLSRRLLISTVALTFTLAAVPAATSVAAATQGRVTARAVMADPGFPHCCVGGNPTSSVPSAS